MILLAATHGTHAFWIINEKEMAHVHSAFLFVNTSYIWNERKMHGQERKCKNFPPPKKTAGSFIKDSYDIFLAQTTFCI